MSEEKIDEQIKEVEEEVVEDVKDGLYTGELDMAYKHGILEKEEEKEEEKEKEEEGDKEEEEVEEKEEDTETEDAEHSEDLDTKFDTMSEDPEKEFEGLKKFNKTDKAFYWKWKNDKKKRQEAQAETEIQALKIRELEERLIALSNKSSQDPLEDLLKENEQAVPLTKAEYEADKKRADEARKRDMLIQTQIQEHEAEAKNKYTDYTRVVKLAEEVMKSDQSGTYWNMFMDAVHDPKKNSAEVAYKLGKMHPQANEQMDDGKAVEKKTDRIEKNLKKKSTSAALGGAGEMGPVKKAYSEMTWKDGAKMSSSEWLSIPKNIRQQMLKASCA